MLYKTRGIVFKFFKYRDTSIIVKVLTEKLGLQTYVVNGVRSKNAKSKIALYQPLTLLEMVVYFKEGAEMHRISEVRCMEPYRSVPYEVMKSSIGVFLAEVLFKSIKEEGEIPELFSFIHDSMMIFDHLDTGFENFHLQFLLKLTRYLGFGIENAFDQNAIGGDTTIGRLLNASYDDHVSLTHKDRREALETIIRFYGTHIEAFGHLRSLKILQEIL